MFRYRSAARHSVQRLLSIVLGGLLFVLGACQEASAPANLPATPTPLAFTMLADLVASGQPAAHQAITTIGYLLVDQNGAKLADTIVFDQVGIPQPLDAGTTPIWVGTDVRAQVQSLLRTAGGVQYAAVVARGRLAGPGSYGPHSQYHYQLTDPTFEPLAAQETTIADMLDHSATYDRRLVRVVGGLLMRKDSALLVEQLNSGGIPAPKARQIKLRGSIDDQALLARLHGPANGLVRFGQVQIEGLWRDGVLTPLAITIVT